MIAGVPRVTHRVGRSSHATPAFVANSTPYPTDQSYHLKIGVGCLDGWGHF